MHPSKSVECRARHHLQYEEMGMEAAELARWTRFAAKGGIGKCIATADCVAESSDDLMFLKVSSTTGSVLCRFLIALQ